MEELILRRATSSDVNAVRDLTRIAYAEWVSLIGREPRPMMADFEQVIKRHIVDLYEPRGQLVALIEMIAEPDHLLIENIAVSPDRQGEGIGTTLLRHAERLSRSLQLKELRLYTNAAFHSNLTFYARRGFHEFMREPLKQGGDIVYMRKYV